MTRVCGGGGRDQGTRWGVGSGMETPQPVVRQGGGKEGLWETVLSLGVEGA